MANLTAITSITATDLTYRGSVTDRLYTGAVVLRPIDPECDGSIILYWDEGKLIGQYHSTTRTLDLISDKTKLTYSADQQTVTQDNSPIKLKSGSYYARFYAGHSAYYAHAAIRSNCGCGWCVEPCDRIWTVTAGSIQGIHEAEKRIPEYDSWIPMAYYLGVYGDSYSDAVRKGITSPIVDTSSMFRSTTTATPIKTIAELLGLSDGNGSHDPNNFLDTPKGLEFLDLSKIDFCSGNLCEPVFQGEKGKTKEPVSCEKCGKTAATDEGRCGCGCD
jgi:hypothetical protein